METDQDGFGQESQRRKSVLKYYFNLLTENIAAFSGHININNKYNLLIILSTCEVVWLCTVVFFL